MATNFHSRKLFPFLPSSSNLPPPCANFCDPACSNFDECYLLPDPDLNPPDPSPPPPPPPGHEPIPVTAAAIVVIVVLVSFFLLVSYCAIFTRWTRLRTRRRNPHAYPESEIEDMDGGDELVDNPIWFISTVGLQQAVIDSIKVIKYSKDEGLFEGRDCSVCLNEFEEGESIRLLPKCNHAFHVECIDTWLRSHTNCPLCRANIAPDPGGPHLGPNDPSFGHSRRAQVAHVGDLDTNDVESGGARTGDGDDGLEDNRGETGEGSRLQVRRSASMHFCPGWNSVGPNLQTNPKFGSFRMSGGSSSSSSCRATGGSSSQVKRSYSWSERVFGSARFQKRNSDPEGSS